VKIVSIKLKESISLVEADPNPMSQIWEEENSRLEQDEEKAPRTVYAFQLSSNLACKDFAIPKSWQKLWQY
jgi:hypothetical protein